MSDEQILQQKFPDIDISVIQYILNTIAGGNLTLAQDTLANLPRQQIQELQQVFYFSS